MLLARQLPRSPSETGLVIYKAKDARGGSKLIGIRRQRVRDFLEFFCTYHHYFRNGIHNARSTGAHDEYLVPPIRFDAAAVDRPSLAPPGGAAAAARSALRP